MLATSPADRHVFHVTSYKELHDISGLLKLTLCPGTHRPLPHSTKGQRSRSIHTKRGLEPNCFRLASVLVQVD